MPATRTVSAGSRFMGLDMLRGAAVLLVLGRHPREMPPELSGATRGFFELWLQVGWVGVDLFFVLSGFLVSGLLLSEQRATGKVNVWRFLLRRGFKIYPLFWCLLVLTALMRSVRDEAVRRSQLLAELLFVQNYFDGLWRHTWSLAVEEHFYLGLALLFVILGRRGGSLRAWPVPALTVALLILALAARLAGLSLGHATLFLSHCRIDSLFVGVAGRWLWEISDRRWAPPRWAIACGLVVSLGLPSALPAEGDRMLIWGLPLVAIGFALVVLGSLDITENLRRFGAPFAAVGRWSYGVYLFHMPMVHWGIDFMREQGLRLRYELEFLAYVSGSLLAGFLATRFIEQPCLRLRDRLVPSGGHTAPPLEGEPRQADPLSPPSVGGTGTAGRAGASGSEASFRS